MAGTYTTGGYTTAGVVYDTAEVDRIKGWIKQQEDEFTKQEAIANKKEWTYITIIVVVSVVSILLVTKKMLK